MELKRRGNDRGSMALEAVVVFTAGGEVKMEKGDGALLLSFFGLGMDNGFDGVDTLWPRVVHSRRQSLSLSVSAVSGRLEEMHRVWSKPKRLPYGPRAKGSRLE
uniref:Uncharacterized protein n=1 Tax=Oryza rufipogon TaxID=4529 RepID=A0A0E0PXR2_ORYRU